jgi:hypothetical protein
MIVQYLSQQCFDAARTRAQAMNCVAIRMGSTSNQGFGEVCVQVLESGG